MIRNKSRSLDIIGKRRYDFDFQLEKIIYCWVCCLYVKKKKLKKLDNNLKFNSYKQWKEYIQNKYSSCNNETLFEFSKYLNQRIRIVKPSEEYWKLVTPVLMTLVITKWMEAFLSIETGLSEVSFLVVLFAIVLIMISYFFLIWKLTTPILESSIEEYMLEDYKEIIDGMIFLNYKGLEE